MAKNCGILLSRMDQKVGGGEGGAHKNEFQIQKSGKRKQVHEIIGVIPAVSMFSS